MNKINSFIRMAALLVAFVSLFACGNSSVDKFREAMGAGNLTEAQGYLMKIDDREECKTYALQLIRAYMEAEAVDKAIHVFESITPWHKNRYDMKWNNGEYERTVCKLLREYLLKNGEYETAWGYYPLEYDDENSAGNAQCRYAYLSDVVADMCAKGKRDEARRFVENQLRWFVIFVDTDSSKYNADMREAFNSAAVREKLNEQIENSY